MSPGIIALFSARGVQRVWYDKKHGGLRMNPHRCQSRCWREGCIWQRLLERPC